MTKKQHSVSIMCLIGVPTILAFFTFCLGLRGVGGGTWPQSESVMAGVLFLAVFPTIGLLIRLWRSPCLESHYFNPLVFLPFLIGALSLVLLPFDDLPVRSFLGAVRSGEGAVWWLSLSTFSAASIMMWKLNVWRQALIAAAIASFVACFALSMIHRVFETYFAPLYFTDYLAFAFVCLIPVIYPFFAKQESRWLKWLLFYLVLNGVMILSDNKAMMVYAMFMPLVLWGGWALTVKRGVIQDRLSYAVILLIPTGGILFFLGLSALFQTEGFYAFSSSGAFRTVASRAYLVDVSFQALVDHPARFLTGFGWGSFVDHITQYQPAQWIDFTQITGKQWDGFSKDHFHSHNMFIETMNALGITGLVLLVLYFAAFPVVAAASVKKAAFMMSAGLMIWGSFWFFMPNLFAFMVFAAASVSGRYYPLWAAYKHSKLLKGAIAACLCAIAALQLLAFWMIFDTARMTDTYDPAPISVETAQTDCPSEYRDYGAGGLHLSRIILDRLRYTVDLADTQTPSSVPKEGPEAIPDHVRSLNSLFCQAGHYIQHNESTDRLVVAHLLMRGEILLGLMPYIDEETKAYYERGWEDELLRWLERVPARADLATPFFLYNLSEGQEELSVDVAALIHQQTPHHPLGLWFKGLYLLQDDKTVADGIGMMRAALENGIERFIPVDAEVKAMIGGAHIK